ncbi:MAG: hypothetical protein JKY81_06280 [Colwellia sp.]|nr:hypothetical protein [Colwellia sp.]
MIKIFSHRFTLIFIALLTLIAILLHGFYFEISLFHGLVLHPLFLLAVLLLLSYIEKRSQKK